VRLGQALITAFLLASLQTVSAAQALPRISEAPSNSDSKDEQVKLSEILIPLSPAATPEEVAAAQKETEGIFERLKAGASFEQEAREHSKGPTAAEGGTLGYFGRGKLAPALEALVFSLKVGEITRPIRTRQGVVIIKVTDRLTGPPPKNGAVDILSDTGGFNVGPYLSSVLERIRKQWFALIPPEARAPLYKHGAVAVVFTIRKDGTEGDTKITTSSEDPELDRAALGAITSSSPLPALPYGFPKDTLTIRLRFFYNPNQLGRELK